MKMRISKLIQLTVLFYLVAVAGQTARAEGAIRLTNPLGNTSSVPQLVNNIVTAILGIVGAVALFMFIYGGLLWMTSGGVSTRIEKGRNTLVWATIGLLVIFGSYAILSFIFSAVTGASGG